MRLPGAGAVPTADQLRLAQKSNLEMGEQETRMSLFTSVLL